MCTCGVWCVWPCPSKPMLMLSYSLSLQNISNSQDVSSTILYKDIDGEVSTFCLNSVTRGHFKVMGLFIIILC